MTNGRGLLHRHRLHRWVLLLTVETGGARPAVVLRPAVADDHEAIAALLRESGLPTVGLDADTLKLMVAVHDARVVASAGLERVEGAALLRSVSVAASVRGQGVAQALVETLLARADATGVGETWLLTETAADYFPRFGFVRAPRASAPAALQGTVEFASCCPASAVAMVRHR